MPQKGFATVFIILALAATVLVIFFLAKQEFNPNSHMSSGKLDMRG